MNYNPYRKYSSYWWKYWLNLPSDAKWFFKRIWLYRNILWNDTDYDFSSILRIISFKAQRMSEHFTKHRISARTLDNVAELAKLQTLLRNVMGEDPDDEWSLHHDQWHSKKGFNEPCPQSKKACLKASIASIVREERNWRALWAYIEAHMRGWWD